MDPETESLLLQTASTGDPVLQGAADHRGRPAKHASSGGWLSAAFIIGVEIAERFAYYGVHTNLITYLTTQLGEPTASAAINVNTWEGVAFLTPLLGGLVADSCLGRYTTVAAASCLYLVGLSMLTLSAWLLALHPSPCAVGGGACSRATGFQAGFVFASIYLVALAQGGHRPCVQAFGADQFDEKDPAERRAKSSFFNWWFFGMCSGTLVVTLLLPYIQDNVSWVLGFGIPLGSAVVSLVVFLAGTPTYRFYHQHPRHGGGSGSILIATGEIMRLFPIWATCLPFAVVNAQSPTFFTKQGATMDCRVDIGSVKFQVPPAALQSFISATIVAFIPIYDLVLVRTSRRLTGNPSGLTLLQRVGAGLLLSLASMIIAALVEARRLAVATQSPAGTLPFVPMSLWWIVPQYVLFGVSDVFIIVGLQEFFYDQVSVGLRSVGVSLYLSIFGFGSLLSGLLVYVADKASKNWGGDGKSWFDDDLNSGHLDYFYWLLAGISAAAILMYIYYARCYTYRKGSTADY